MYSGGGGPKRLEDVVWGRVDKFEPNWDEFFWGVEKKGKVQKVTDAWACALPNTPPFSVWLWVWSCVGVQKQGYPPMVFIEVWLTARHILCVCFFPWRTLRPVLRLQRKPLFSVKGIRLPRGHVNPTRAISGQANLCGQVELRSNEGKSLLWGTGFIAQRTSSQSLLVNFHEKTWEISALLSFQWLHRLLYVIIMIIRGPSVTRALRPWFRISRLSPHALSASSQPYVLAHGFHYYAQIQ